MSTPSDPQPDATRTQQGTDVHDRSVPEPDTGVRGADQVGGFDSAPGQGTTSGADGETPAREALRKDLGERPASAGEETGAGLAEGGALGEDDPQGGSLGESGSRP